MAFDAFWDLYALPFARLEKRRVHDHFIVRDMHDGPMPVDFYVWVARRGEQIVNPVNTFDYTPALIQFVLSNRLVDVALVGMRTVREVESCVGIWKDESGRIDVDALWHRFIADQKANA